MTDWRKVQGSQKDKPLEFDTTSSAIVVYQRKNIERVSNTDEMTGETYESWEYDERKLSREEYALIRTELQQQQIDQNIADIAFISAMTDVDLSN